LGEKFGGRRKREEKGKKLRKRNVRKYREQEGIKIK
jgi:hypothetical protein